VAGSRPALEPTQPPVEWVLWVFASVLKQLGHKADHSQPSGAGVTNEWCYTLSLPICLHGMYRDSLIFDLLCDIVSSSSVITAINFILISLLLMYRLNSGFHVSYL
jgi:hypothetical protein